jgi:hypothetical protein
MLISFRDEWEEEDEPEDNDEEADALVPVGPEAAGSDLRLRVQEELLKWFYDANN